MSWRRKLSSPLPFTHTHTISHRKFSSSDRPNQQIVPNWKPVSNCLFEWNFMNKFPKKNFPSQLCVFSILRRCHSICNEIEVNHIEARVNYEQTFPHSAVQTQQRYRLLWNVKTNAVAGAHHCLKFLHILPHTSPSVHWLCDARMFKLWQNYSHVQHVNVENESEEKETRIRTHAVLMYSSCKNITNEFFMSPASVSLSLSLSLSCQFLNRFFRIFIATELIRQEDSRDCSLLFLLLFATDEGDAVQGEHRTMKQRMHLM